MRNTWTILTKFMLFHQLCVCGLLYVTFWKKEEEKKKTNVYICQEINNKNISKLKRTTFDKTVRIAILGPIHFSQLKFRSRFLLHVSSRWYARNKNATKIADHFTRRLALTHSHTYARTHTFPTRHSISVLCRRVLKRYIIYVERNIKALCRSKKGNKN